MQFQVQEVEVLQSEGGCFLESKEKVDRTLLLVCTTWRGKPCVRSDVGEAAWAELARVWSIPFFLLADPCQLKQLATAQDRTLMTQW